ncbi:MAG: hypothetical protein JWM65_3389 [Sphingomonas bacterium]|nr:hypothetical protein [Sphingomonas bacterium]
MDNNLYARTLAPLLFVSAVLAGVSFWPMSHVLTHGTGFVVWKTAGVAMLALWSLLVARNGDGRLLALVLTFGAVGDAVLEMSQTFGGAAFLVGHMLAFTLYRRYRRPDAQWVVLVIALVIPFIAWLLTHDVGVTVYACGLGAMTGSAWGSRLPRHQVALGAAMFAVSDLLIFSRFHVLHNSPVPGLLIWPLYFAGQALIAWGAGRTLAKEQR